MDHLGSEGLPVLAGLPLFGWPGAGFEGVGLVIVAGVGDGWGVFADGFFGVGVGLADVFAFAGTGTRITPPSGGINWLPPFGSIVYTCPPGWT